MLPYPFIKEIDRRKETSRCEAHGIFAKNVNRSLCWNQRRNNSGILTVYLAVAPPCVHFHWGVVAQYSTLNVVEGSYSSDKVYVIHGCPEVKRTVYSERAGNLQAFHIGDLHRLRLTRMNIFKIGTIVDSDSSGRIEHPDDQTYFAKTVDLE